MEKYGGYVICVLVLLAALQLSVTGAVDTGSADCPSGYGTLTAGAALTVAASAALTGVYVAESDADDGFVAPADTYTATGTGVTAVLLILLIVSTVALARSDRTQNSSAVTGITTLLAFIALLVFARWEARILRDVPKRIAQHHVNALYDLLARWDAFSSESDLNYFIVSHTLLGAVRHGGLAPWDDTATVGIMDTDLHALSDVGLLRRYGLRAKLNPITGEVRVLLTNKRFPYIRVVTYDEPQPHAAAPGVWTSKQLPKAPIADALLHDDNGHLRKDYVFGPLRLSGPANGAMVLAQQFGDKVNTHITEPAPHDERRVLLSTQGLTERELTDADRNPLTPSS